jgi:hypothetical protein
MSDSQSMATTNRQPSAMSGTGFEGVGDIGKKVTVAEPFNLTKPRPKVIPQPEALPKIVAANPIPEGLFKKNLKDFEKEKEDRRKATIQSVRKEFEENPKQRFALATEALPSANKFAVKKE